MSKKRGIAKVAHKFTSFEAAESHNRRYRQNISPVERIDIVFALMEMQATIVGTPGVFTRVCRVTKRE